MRRLPIVIVSIVAASLCGALIRGAAPGEPRGQQRPAAGAPGGKIRGRVELPTSGGTDRRPSVTRLGAPMVDVRAQDLIDRRVSVVYLERAPRGAFGELEERRVRIDQRRERFVPHVVAITVGSSVDFPNNDRTYHNVFSLSDAKTFDLGRYAAGRSKSVRFERPGIVRVFCDIHSHMSAFVLVFAHRFFDVTDPEGRYRIDGVPAGTYTVTLWNETIEPEQRQVVVPDGGEVEVHFAPGRVRSTSD